MKKAHGGNCESWWYSNQDRGDIEVHAQVQVGGHYVVVLSEKQLRRHLDYLDALRAK